eukprot:TRINITY_DN91178_c0_g1_i1.p1 TRINITY_DN91178_c0_g1~~TRINITY_DN91178_c0_g1_i1.p1  ORF type:complete len:467 (-),score=95.80 TRINITY_DN91178_c0_g1_i1:27-1427(-)
MALALPGLTQAYAPAMSQEQLMAVDPTAPRIKVLGPGCELRLIVDDDKHARVKLIAEQIPNPRPGQPSATSAEIFGAEMVPGQEYPLLGGTRTAIFTWHGCKIQVHGPTVQEYDAPNIVMRDYLGCAAVLEQRRQRADDLGLPAPRVLVCGSAFSGKSALCQILCNYAMRREHTPIFVELDSRYSCCRQLQSIPACVTAMTVEHAHDEEPLNRMAYFFGHLDWSDNPRLYERVISHLSRVVHAKLTHSTSREGARTSSSGLVVNAPYQPTPALLQKIIDMFDIDVVLVLDSEGLHAALCKMYAGCPKVNGVPKVEIVPLPKAGGVVQAAQKRIRFMRALRVRDYFYGVMRDFHPFSVLVDLSDVQLVQIETALLSASMLPLGQESQKSVEFIVRAFSGQAAQLENALLGVVRANSMNEVLYAPMCGLVLVTKVEESALQLLCPAPPPLPAQYLLVGDFKNLKFIDI